MVRDILGTFGTFLTPLLSLYRLPLKVDGNKKREKKRGVKTEIVFQVLYGIVAIGGHFKFEHAVFL